MGRPPRRRAKTATWSGSASDVRDTIREALGLGPWSPKKARRPMDVFEAAASESDEDAETCLEDTPHRLGPYEIIGVLGQGGMARVYLAEHEIIGKQVAIKTPLPAFAQCPAALSIFVREARIAGAIRHQSVIDIYDFAIDHRGRPYCVMELAPGETLAARLERQPLLLSQSLDVIVALADATAAIHAAGYLHRDIKSENVLLTLDGRRIVPKLIDFGIARPIATEPGSESEGLVGTPRTMAPEQIAQDAVDERTDVWALGVLLYEMLTGELPFPTGQTLREDIVAIVTEPPRPLPAKVPADVSSIVLSCLAKDPEERPSSAAALVRKLRGARADYLVRHDMVERALIADEAWSVVAELEAEERRGGLAA